jgi:rhomboid protease GluP
MREGPLGEVGYKVRARTERAPLLRALNGASVTSVLIGANVVVFVLMLLTRAPTSVRTLARFGALIAPVPPGQWWRLVTAMFVHIGPLHLLFNMFALTIFGGTIELRYGKARFLALYLGSGVLGSAASLAFSHARISAGASGAVFGIFGAWIALALTHRSHPAMRGQLRSLLFLVGFNLYIGATTPGVDNGAHVGGLVGGMIIAGLIEASAKVRGAARVATAVAGYVVVAIAAYLVAAPHML